MKFRGLLVAVAVLAVLAGLSYWSNKKKAAADAKPPADASPKILTIPDDQFKQIKVAKTGGDTTVLQRGDDNKWKITEPKPLNADQDSVSSLVSTLSSLSSDRLIEDKASDLSQYGLNKPTIEVTVTKKDGKTETVLLGDDTPTGGGEFAMRQGDPRVFTIASYVKTSVDKSYKDLRDKRLLTFDSDKLTRVALQGKGEVEFGKNNQNDWQILKPKPLRADGSQVEDLIRKLKDAKMDTSVSEEDAKKAATAFAGGKRVGVATVTDATGNQQLEVRESGKDKDKTYYAKSSVMEGIYKVQNDLGEAMNKAVDDFRNKKLFDFGWSDPTKVQIGTVTYQKSGDKWNKDGKTMDSTSMQNLIDKLRDLAATKFQDTAGGTQVFEATVTSNDGKRIEKVAINKQGDQYLAKRENEPSIYVLDAKPVDDLIRAAGEVKEAAPAKAETPKKKK
jgi:Domain of unknown function (DUF4340)